MKDKWLPPGKLTEPAGTQLGAFGITRLPGARINATDPAVSQSQQAMMGADLRRKRMGKKTRTGMTTGQLEEYAGTRRRGLPKRTR